MEHSSPVSKIVATATASSWAQAYSAGKLNLCLSLDGETDENVTSLGKDILEKIQREFFALDEKNLETLKSVVTTVTETIPPTAVFSLVMTTIVTDVLYIVIANLGSVLLKRGGEISVIGNGEKDQVIGFSGKLEPEDIILTATSGLLKTVTHENLSKAFKNNAPHEIGESLAPFLHENASGTEAALIWKMIGSKKTLPEEEIQDPEHPNDTLSLEEKPQEKKESFKTPNITEFFSKMMLFLKEKMPQVRLGKRQIIILAAILLVVILSGSLYFEKGARKSKEETAQAALFLTPARQQYDDALALISLNRALAVEELQQIKTEAEAEKSKFPAGSNAFLEIETFLAQVNKALSGEVGGSSQINVFFDALKNSEIPNVSNVTVKNGEIVAVGSTKGGLLSETGTVRKTFDTGGSIIGITADEKNVYIIQGNTVSEITKSDGKKSTLVKNQSKPVSIDTFGGNIYLLSGTDKTVYKYRPTSYDKESYFTKDTILSNPSSISIDASVYVVDGGKILKFTRGTTDTFSYAGKPLSSNTQIYTDVDYENLYVLDSGTKTAIVLSKKGTVISEVNLKGMKNMTSIAADEKNKKMYVCADNKIYEISF